MCAGHCSVRSGRWRLARSRWPMFSGGFFNHRSLGGGFIGKLRMRERMRMAVVASEAADLRMAFEIILVNRGSHIDHLARCFLFVFVVGIELMLDVTELTISVQGPREIPHLVDEFRCGQVLQRRGLYVLEVYSREFFRLA